MPDARQSRILPTRGGGWIELYPVLSRSTDHRLSRGIKPTAPTDRTYPHEPSAGGGNGAANTKKPARGGLFRECEVQVQKVVPPSPIFTKLVGVFIIIIPLRSGDTLHSLSGG